MLFITAEAVHGAKPNFVIIFTDDQGYSDLSCFGSKTIRTPNIDRIAKEGRKFTSFMVASPVCTPSRSALLTGCYPKRVGMHQHVLFPSSTKGLNPKEHTIADHLKSQGYATACFGKWHLGHHTEVLPTANGFDTYYGIPYSNDMNHPDNKGKPRGGWQGMDILWNDPESTLTKWKTPLLEDEKIVELPVDQRTVTRRYTQKSIDFIKTNKDKPFFVYLPHSMPHIPLYVPDEVRDPDPKNAYINTIEHIDTEVGRLLKTLDELKLSSNTYVIYTTDNGPWLPFRHHGGSAGGLRDGKGSTFEGGMREATVIRWPGKIPAGKTNPELMTTMDLLPTFAKLAGAQLPERKRDGQNIWPVWSPRNAKSPHDHFFYYHTHSLQAVRDHRWKLVLGQNPKLYDLKTDSAEKTNLAAKHPEIIQRLQTAVARATAELGSGEQQGLRVRPVGRATKPTPRIR